MRKMKQHFLNARDGGFLQLSDRINKLSVQARLLDVKSHLKRQKKHVFKCQTKKMKMQNMMMLM